MTERPQSRQILRMIGAGTEPDPATYCPANGYILNPINPADGWVLIAEFQNNSPDGTTFDPAITTSSGDYAWDLGDGTYLVGDKSVFHTYLTTATRTVKIYKKGTSVITAVNFSTDNLIGALDLSVDEFKPLTQIYLDTNLELTSILFPPIMTGVVINLQLQSTGIIGNIDLSMFTQFSSAANVQLFICPALTSITFASSISGTFAGLLIYSTGIIGTLDLSKFTTFTTTGSIQLHSNPSVTAITFASTITGTFASLLIYSTGIIGTLDLSKFTTFTTTATIRLYSNLSMTGVTFANTITGTISALWIYSTGIVGVLDLSKFTSFTTTGALRLYSNPTLTSITFASSITGTMGEVSIYSTGISGILDLSKFITHTTTGIVDLNSNASMTGVIFPSSTITGFIRTLRLYSNTSLGYVDLTKLRTGVASLNWDMKNNGWSAAIVNQVLVDIDGISASGFTGRVINIGGTNADPDTTSGGYNGSAARTSLIAKGFTVTIT